MSRAEAEAIAVSALATLAGDPERLSRFLDLTGLRPDTIRQAAASPRFLAAVLDHVAGDEALLIETAAGMGVAPERLARARQILDPELSFE